jgi:hypothetical protein
MISNVPLGGSWSVRTGRAFVPFERAEAPLLLTAASGLAGEIVHEGDLVLATRLAEAYLRLSPDDNVCPITVLARIETPHRTFSGVCLGEHLTVRADGQLRKIPLRLVRKVTSRQVKGWSLRAAASSKIELIDGSSYRDLTLVDRDVSVLTLLGTQVVKFDTVRTSIQGHSVGNLGELRARLETVLDGHHQALVRTVGAERFENFFRAA